MKIQKELCAWFNENHRQLPFRESKNPYSIWVSEIMAQQTRIESMLTYYEKWMNDYPTIEALANAPIEKVLKSWEGLGYYNRARKLHEGAKQVMQDYQGELPRDVEELKKISGIGPYTAGAIASIAFDIHAPAVDGNVLRVISRLYELEDDIAKPKTINKVREIVQELMIGSNPSDFTQGLMELGALVCMPKVTLCNQCPLSHVCQACRNHTQLNYPIKTKAKKAPIYQYKTLLIIKDNQILLSRDDRDGLMKDFYRLPQYEEFDTTGYQIIKPYQHVYSHKIWKMDLYQYVDGNIPNDEYVDFKNIDELDEIPIIGAHRKMLEDMFKKINIKRK